MKILLLGADGQLGRQLRRSLSVLGEVRAPARSAGDEGADLCRPQSVAALLSRERPAAVVNAAAWTDVDGAERDPDAAWQVNADGPAALAQACDAIGAWLVHMSTDYVYDGSGERPWREDDAARPLSAYGRGKLAGDSAVMARTARHLVLRTGWLHEPGHRNFVTSVLRCAQEREAVQVVADQWGAPTRAALVADVAAQMLTRVLQPGAASLAGLYHVAAAGATSRLACAQLVVECARAKGMLLALATDGLRPGTLQGSPGSAARPANCRLDTSKLRDAFGVRPPAWEDGVRDAIARIAATARKGAP